MNAVGAVWGLGLILDQNLTMALIAANGMATLITLSLLFHNRRWYDRLFIGFGLFALLNTLSFAAMYWFAHVPIRDLQWFSVH